MQHHGRLAPRSVAWYAWLAALITAQLMLMMCVLEESWHLVAFYTRIYRLLSTVQPRTVTGAMAPKKSSKKGPTPNPGEVDLAERVLERRNEPNLPNGWMKGMMRQYWIESLNREGGEEGYKKLEQRVRGLMKTRRKQQETGLPPASDGAAREGGPAQSAPAPNTLDAAGAASLACDAP